jgi:phospholipase/carboxylesterase
MRRYVLFALALTATTLGCDRGAAPASPDKTPTQPAPSAPADPATPDPAPQPEPARPAPLPKAAQLHYHEVLLGGAQAEDSLPMIVAIHGLGDDPRNFAALFDTFPEPARLILPRGVDETEGGGWSWFPIRARSADVEGLAAGIGSSADKIAEALSVLVEDKPTQGRPIVTGFSQGGMLSFALAVEHPEVVEVSVPVGGWLPPPMWPEALTADRYPQTLALHGTADNAVRYEPTKESVDHLTKLGFPIELKSYEGVQHVITPEIQRDLFDRLVDAVRSSAKP